MYWIKFSLRVSLILPRDHDLNEKTGKVSSYVTNVCDNIGFKYIRHEHTWPNIHLNANKLHLTKKGNVTFVSNFKRYLNSTKWSFYMEKRILTSLASCSMYNDDNNSTWEFPSNLNILLLCWWDQRYYNSNIGIIKLI